MDHYELLADLKQRMMDDNHPLYSYVEETPAREILSEFFENFHDGSKPRGLRLTPTGLAVLKTYYSCTHVPLDSAWSPSTGELIALERQCRYPYYVEQGSVVFFEDALAAMVSISGKLTSILDLP